MFPFLTRAGVDLDRLLSSLLDSCHHFRGLDANDSLMPIMTFWGVSFCNRRISEQYNLRWFIDDSQASNVLSGLASRWTHSLAFLKRLRYPLKKGLSYGLTVTNLLGMHSSATLNKVSVKGRDETHLR